LQVEYANMRQSINKIAQILKEYYEQDDRAYQTNVIQIEEESRNIITEHVRAYTVTICMHILVYGNCNY